MVHRCPAGRRARGLEHILQAQPLQDSSWAEGGLSGFPGTLGTTPLCGRGRAWPFSRGLPPLPIPCLKLDGDWAGRWGSGLQMLDSHKEQPPRTAAPVPLPLLWGSVRLCVQLEMPGVWGQRGRSGDSGQDGGRGAGSWPLKLVVGSLHVRFLRRESLGKASVTLRHPGLRARLSLNLAPLLQEDFSRPAEHLG